MKTNNQVMGMAPELLKLVQRAEEINPRQVTRKAIFNASAIIGAVTLGAVDFWLLLYGQITTAYEKRFALFVALCAVTVLLAGLLSLCSLFMSLFSYQRLRLLMEKIETAEATEETEVLIEVVGDAVRDIPQQEQRERLVETLTHAPLLRKHPILTERLGQKLAHA